MTLPFSGVKVIDLAAPVSAYCARVLAGYGADVLRIDPPDGRSGDRDDARAEWLDAWYAAGCRSMTLDVSDERAVPLLAELAATADVVIASPSAVTPVAGFVDTPLGLSWAPATAVTCLLTPFGATGPLRNWKATPLTAHAMSGLMYAIGPEVGPPLSMPGRQLWDGAGIRAAICIAAALSERLHVGGQVLDISAHEVMAGQDDILHRFDVAGLVMRRQSNFGVPPSGTWPVADGTVDIAVNTPGHWDAFVKTMGSPPELTDPMWEDRTVRLQLHDVLTETIVPLLAARSKDELIAAGQGNGMPCSALNTPEQFIADLRREQRRPLGTLTRSDLGTCDVPGSPIHLAEGMYARDLVAPITGAHTDAVLVEELGHAPEELAGWREQGLV